MTWDKYFICDFNKGILYRDGEPVGCKDAYGYLIVGVNYKLYKVHRIIWEMKNGAIPKGLVIDHINQDKSDNRLLNLRLATKSQNALNAKVRSDNQQKCTGVSWKKDKKKYKAYITLNGKQRHLGYFNDKEDAIKARKKEEARITDSC